MYLKTQVKMLPVSQITVEHSTLGRATVDT